ncbi:hypothetical protein KC845_03515 [Candidatus Kaiserbacteria bacterium]|nr:hypothetical protein [Candidatus Kaiserbacteria bacterium]
MFVLSKRAASASQVIATLLAIATVMFTLGVYNYAQAANLTSVSNTLTDSNPSSLSGHFVSFTIPTGSSLGTGDTVTITFPTGFTGVATATSGDLVVRVDGGAPVAIGAFSAVGQNISFNNVAATAGQVVTVEIEDYMITNPATVQSYEFTISTGTDTGKTRVAIVDNVTVSAIVQTSFDFVVSGLASSTIVNNVTSTISGTTTTIPFGILTADTPASVAQRLQVTTNAVGGFIVTVEQDQDLLSSTGADINSFVDGSYENSPTTWASPADTLGNTDTYGHWGLTTNDGDLTGGAFGNDEFVAASTTPRLVFDHNGSSDGTTQNIGQVDVLYQVEITSLQEAADDYNTTLTYIATPTF